MDVPEISDSLKLDETGIWRATHSSPVSYPESYNEMCFELEDSSVWFRHRNECIVAAVRHFPPDGPILDVGGGNGFVTRRLVDEGFRTILLEPGPAGALNARTRRQCPEVICATFEDAGIKRDSLPAVALFDVLEHVQDDRDFLRRLHATLRPGGMLYLTVPAHQWLWSAADIEARHFRRYDRPMLTTLLADGFETLYSSYFFSVLTLPLFLLRTVPCKLRLATARESPDYRAVHGTRGGFAARVLERLMRFELRAVRAGRPLSAGTSCLVAARKKRSTSNTA